MSYQWVDLALRNVKKLATNSHPLVIDLGALTGNDASFLRVAIEVGTFAGPDTAVITLEQSHDGGTTWVTVANTTTTPITAVGTYTIETTAASGILSPNVRVKITPAATVGIGVTRLRRTLSDGPAIPTAATGGATEATLQDILDAVDGLEAGVASIAAEDFATETSLAALLAAFAAENFATETTLASILAALAAPVGVSRSAVGTPYFRDYSVNNINDTGWTEIVAATAAGIRKLHIFDSSGEFIRFATGAAAAEVEVFRIEPGGPGPVELLIPAGTRLSIRAVTGTISVGNLNINFLT